MNRFSAAAFLLLLLPALGAAAAQAPVPATVDDGSVTYYSWQAGTGYCSGADPALGLAGLAFLSRVSHEAVDGGTRYDLHLESVTVDPACPALDISFVTSLAPWPTQDAHAFASADCGLQGFISVYPGPEGRHLQGYFQVPEACGLGVGSYLYFGVGLTSLHPSPYMACAPVYVVVAPCAGVGETNRPTYRCMDGSHYESTYVPLILTVSRHCDWQTGESMVVVSPVAGVVEVEARESSCTVVFHDYVLGALDQRAPCPAEVGALLYGTDWGDVLP